MSSLCNYKHLFGEPNQGLHSYRFLGLAAIDIISTIIASLIVSYVFKYNFGVTLLVFIILGIFSHRLFCVRTTIDKLLFP